MSFLPHLAGRVLGVPLLVERARLETILAIVGPRVSIETAGFAPDVPPPTVAANRNMTEEAVLATGHHQNYFCIST